MSAKVVVMFILLNLLFVNAQDAEVIQKNF